MSKFLIYALLDPTTKEIKYIGKSCSGFKRPRQHLQPCYLKRKTKCSSWIKSLLSKELKPEILILEETTKEKCSELEIFYISYFKFLGAKLTNLTSGGEGRAGFRHSNESKKNISKFMTGNKFNIGRKLTTEHKEALHNARKNSSNSIQHNQAVSKALKGRKLSEEHKRKISESRKSYERDKLERSKK